MSAGTDHWNTHSTTSSPQQGQLNEVAPVLEDLPGWGGGPHSHSKHTGKERVSPLTSWKCPVLLLVPVAFEALPVPF